MLHRILALILPIVTTIIALSVAQVLAPPEGSQPFTNFERDLFALALGVMLGAAMGWLIYGGDGGESG